MHAVNKSDYGPLILSGVAIILGPMFIWVALFGWDNFFQRSFKAQLLAKAFGKTGARIFYLSFGLIGFVLGILKLLHVW